MADYYLLLKLIHILGAVVVTGTGAGIAFFMLMAWLSKDWRAMAVTSRHVVLADWIFTFPAVIIQLVSGLLLMQALGFAFDSPWFIAVISLFVFIGLCWLPVIFIQYKLRALANSSEESAHTKAVFNQWMKRWTALGIPAFAAILVIFWLMVFKPLAVA